MAEFPISHMFANLFLLLVLGYLCYSLFLKPESWRLKLRKQGIRGPWSPHFFLGNIPEIEQATVRSKTETPSIDGDCFSAFPVFRQWHKKYGNMFTFKLGGLHMLYASNPAMVKQLKLLRSLDMGKPAYLSNDRGVLLGKGIITSNGSVWSHTRGILSRQLQMDKVKDAFNIIVESGSNLVRSWERLIETKGGIADTKIDEHVITFTSTIISKIMFGHDHDKGMKIAAKCWTLFRAMGSPSTLGIPFLRYLPNKENREAWKLAKEIHLMIMDIAKGRSGCNTPTHDMFQAILEGSNNGHELGRPPNADEFIVDNCKGMMLAASSGTAISAIWGLMLLASHPDWQARTRSEVLQVCGGRLPNFDMLCQMKMLKMVVQEVLRLYPSVALVSRQALQGLKLCDIQVPKGVNLWMWSPALHRDPEFWGPDADKFNPERFIDGVSGACKSPHAYIPFGVGARLCPGQDSGIIQLKVLFALILSNFNLSISPNYYHSPTLGLLLEPEHGVNLLIQKIHEF